MKAIKISRFIIFGLGLTLLLLDLTFLILWWTIKREFNMSLFLALLFIGITLVILGVLMHTLIKRRENS
jgi:hypothetical protein